MEKQQQKAVQNSQPCVWSPHTQQDRRGITHGSECQEFRENLKNL